MATNRYIAASAATIVFATFVITGSAESAQNPVYQSDSADDQIRLPPDPLPPCPPALPGDNVSSNYTNRLECMTFDELHGVYMKKEGHNHKGLLFSYVFERFVSKNTGLPVNEEVLHAALGKQDFTKESFGVDGFNTKQYAFLFSYNGDWVLIATVENGLLLRTTFSTMYGKKFRADWNIQ